VIFARVRLLLQPADRWSVGSHEDKKVFRVEAFRLILIDYLNMRQPLAVRAYLILTLDD
jgi:hypothetical protein